MKRKGGPGLGRAGFRPLADGPAFGPLGAYPCLVFDIWFTEPHSSERSIVPEMTFANSQAFPFPFAFALSDASRRLAIT